MSRLSCNRPWHATALTVRGRPPARSTPGSATERDADHPVVTSIDGRSSQRSPRSAPLGVGPQRSPARAAPPGARRRRSPRSRPAAPGRRDDHGQRRRPLVGRSSRLRGRPARSAWPSVGGAPPRSASAAPGQRGDRGERRRPGQTSGSQRPPALHRRLPGHPRAAARAGGPALAVVPAHHRAGGDERARSGRRPARSASARPARALALHQRERHPDRAASAPARRDGPRRPTSSSGAEPARPPPPAPSRHRERVAGRRRSDPVEVVAVVVAELGARRGRRRRRGGPSRRRARSGRGLGGTAYLNAERIRRRSPSSAGATSSPRSSASWRSSSSCSSVEVGRACRPRPAPAGRPGPGPRTWGTPRPRSRNTRPVWVPRGTTRSSAPSSVSNARCAPSAAWVNGTCSSWTQVVALALEASWGRTRTWT